MHPHTLAEPSAAPRRSFLKWLAYALLPAVGLLASCTPRAPLEVSFRQSKLDRAGLVMQVTNTSDKHLACKMVVANQTQDKRTEHSFNLAPKATTEIGLLEAEWSFQTGESVTIEVEGFAPKSFKVP